MISWLNHGVKVERVPDDKEAVDKQITKLAYVKAVADKSRCLLYVYNPDSFQPGGCCKMRTVQIFSPIGDRASMRSVESNYTMPMKNCF